MATSELPSSVSPEGVETDPTKIAPETPDEKISRILVEHPELREFYPLVQSLLADRLNEILINDFKLVPNDLSKIERRDDDLYFGLDGKFHTAATLAAANVEWRERYSKENPPLVIENSKSILPNDFKKVSPPVREIFDDSVLGKPGKKIRNY